MASVMFEDEEEQKEEEAEMALRVRNRCNIWLGAANGFRIQHKSWACLWRFQTTLATRSRKPAQDSHAELFWRRSVKN